MILDRKIYRNHYYTESMIQPQFVDTAILKTLLDKLVALGVISEKDRFFIYSDAAEAVERIPGDNIDMMAELVMLADSTLDDDTGELRVS